MPHSYFAPGAAAAPASPVVPSASAQFAVGIDLGTSHCALAYAPLQVQSLSQPAGQPQDGIALLPIPQRSNAAEVQAHSLLPSMRYQAGSSELGHAWQQPWPPLGSSEAAPAVLGHWARELGASHPQRLVASAKSWLSHAAVDRTAPILPWGAGAEVAKISPLEASAAYLAHLRTAWDAAHPQAPLHQQQVALTVPASFDEGARALTLEAARLAGLPPVQLLEEPKAAFHDWLLLQGDALAAQLATSELVLVVDIGGGTTDLTLIAVEPPTPSQTLPRLTRIAVGEHLMLGGDNMDLSLAHQLEPRFTQAGERLPPARFAQLVQRCRKAKEQLLAEDAPESLAVTLLGGGSRLLAQTRSCPLSRAQVQDMVVEGFFPLVATDATPQRSRSGLRGLGLPYPQDAAITRHLAEFLCQHSPQRWPDTVLLNGGVFHAAALRQRLSEQLAQWRGQPMRVLHNPHPDWAVARGACAHALAQRSPQALPRIEGGAARSYWLALPSSSKKGQNTTAPQAICLLPRGTPEGVVLRLTGRRFALQLGQAVRFNLLARNQGEAKAGELATISGAGWVELPPIAEVLRSTAGQHSKRVEVQLQASMSEVGTLEVRCTQLDSEKSERGESTGAEQEPSWLLPFNVRGAIGAHTDTNADSTDSAQSAPSADVATHPQLPQALALVERIFGSQAQEVSSKEVRQLRASLEKLLGTREGWPLPLLRQLLDALLERSRRRRRSAEHERVWLNLTGWCLRPGLGSQLDAWRMEQLWALYEQGLAHSKEAANWTEWWVLWRRVAPGLDEAQQMQVLEAVAASMQKTVQRNAKARWGSYDDMLRLLAAMEAVPWEFRQEMGQWMLKRLQRPDEPAHTWWAIGRLAARQPLAANAHLVMPPSAAREFLDACLAQDWRKNEHAMFAAVQITRMTGERSLDWDEATRAQVLAKLQASGAPRRWQDLVQSVQALDAQDQQRSLGESLPPGLVLL